jgi:hypothetical protein
MSENKEKNNIYLHELNIEFIKGIFIIGTILLIFIIIIIIIIPKHLYIFIPFIFLVTMSPIIIILIVWIKINKEV